MGESGEKGAGVSIGNFKGVMLCNRPFAGISAAAKTAKQAQSNAPPPFRPACGFTEKLGLNPIRHPPNCVIDRRKKDCVLTKHRQWLAQLTSQKKQMEQELLEQQKLREERRSRFRESQRKARVKVVEERKKEIVDNAEEEKEEKEAEVAGRPMWSLTEKVAEEVEGKEAESLVEFAKALDFDKYMDDLEVRSALEAVQNRINKIKRCESESVPESKEDSEEEFREEKVTPLERSVLDRYKQHDKVEEQKAEQCPEVSREDDELKSVASVKSFLSNASMASLKQVHSARSLSMLAAQVKQACSLEGIKETKEENDIYVEPKIVRIQEDGGSRMSKVKDVNNLPYMHRNPAV